jgi:LysM repeat protein
MISPNLTEIGAGVAVSNGRVYYVIDCAQSTASAAPEAPSAAAMISTPNSNGEVIHEVQLGQTLWQLAIVYNVKIEEIKALNNLLDNNIYAGTKLLIKTGVLQPTAVHTGMPAGDLTVTALSTTAIVQPALAATTAVAPSPPANTNTIIGVMISIIMLALLAGGLFTWIGNSKK